MEREPETRRWRLDRQLHEKVNVYSWTYSSEHKKIISCTWTWTCIHAIKSILNVWKIIISFIHKKKFSIPSNGWLGYAPGPSPLTRVRDLCCLSILVPTCWLSSSNVLMNSSKRSLYAVNRSTELVSFELLLPCSDPAPWPRPPSPAGATGVGVVDVSFLPLSASNWPSLKHLSSEIRTRIQRHYRVNVKTSAQNSKRTVQFKLNNKLKNIKFCNLFLR